MLFLNKLSEQLSCATTTTTVVATTTAVLLHHFNDNVVLVNFHQIFLCDILLLLFPLCVIQLYFNDIRVEEKAVLLLTGTAISSVLSADAEAGTAGAMRPHNAATTGARMLLA
jgi:hypothetical protein